MTGTTYQGRKAALALVLAACVAAPAFGQIRNDDGPPGPGRLPPPNRPGVPPAPPPMQPPPPKHHHGSGLGAAIGAGVVGGLVGGALLNGQRQPPPPGYGPEPAYAPPPPPPPVYDADDEPDCRIVRKPVYDEDGEIVDYRTRRICR